MTVQIITDIKVPSLLVFITEFHGPSGRDPLLF